MVKYTNILIEFEPPILDVDGSPLGPMQYRIEIISPSSSRPGVKQFIPQRVGLPLPLGEPLHLKLAATDLYVPIGRYQVNYYQQGRSDALLSEVWVVPTFPEFLTYRMVLEHNTDLITLPANFYRLISINTEAPYEVRHNQLVFLAEEGHPPGPIEIDYEPGVTRDRLVELGSQAKGPVFGTGN